VIGIQCLDDRAVPRFTFKHILQSFMFLRFLISTWRGRYARKR